MEPWQTHLPPAIDRSQLQESSAGDRAFEQELLHLFVADTQQHLKRLKTAIATQDFDIAQREAHHMKGASAHVGAVTMYAIATAVEVQMRQHMMDQSLPLLNQLEMAYQAVIDQTEQWDQDLTSLS
ncbi:Hpt domain-containing protein [Acaryochloris sp. IP29b_bin.137]|uniref:Hpt domain-containing protein n=1 Tax=Acaryochloris sp. IP29b_bin.137 TaxID=2969217 RepID=UPI002615E749|nr:Hpt domain-containing protein [Acaryochloris sp. IP29b_bin.137]